MTSIADRIDNFIKEYEELERLNIKANKDLSDADLELSSIYHKIEGCVITHVSQSHALIKQLKNVLEKRRVVKAECILLRSTCDNLRSKIGMVKDMHKKQVTKHIEIKNEIITRAR